MIQRCVLLMSKLLGSSTLVSRLHLGVIADDQVLLKYVFIIVVLSMIVHNYVVVYVCASSVCSDGMQQSKALYTVIVIFLHMLVLYGARLVLDILASWHTVFVVVDQQLHVVFI